MRLREPFQCALNRGALAIGVAVLAVTVAAPVTAADSKTQRSSVKANGVQANGQSKAPSISTNGRNVAFVSKASNLVRNDTNRVTDCFTRDQATRSTSLVSVSSTGVASNGGCNDLAISGNGLIVAFESEADNLFPDDTNYSSDIFVRDLTNNTTVLVSVSSLGQRGDSSSFDPAISEDGRFVVYESWASNLVDGDTNGSTDVFLHDRTTGQTTLVSVGSAGQGNAFSIDPSISANGRFVVWESGASNLVNADGNGVADIFIRDLRKGTTSRLNVSSSGAEARGGASDNPTVSADGRFVAFDSPARNLVKGDTNGTPDVFVHDRKNHATTRVSIRSSGGQANAWSWDPTISKNGRYVAFTSSASDLILSDTNSSWDVFVHDRRTKKTLRVSVANGGGQARGGNSHDAWLSGDGRFVTFVSSARNLVSSDTNKKNDVFWRGRLY